MNFQTIVGVGFVRKRCNSQAHRRKMRREEAKRVAYFIDPVQWFIPDPPVPFIPRGDSTP